MSPPPNLFDDVVKLVPSYADLFGESAFCACEDCESVLSPAAYFVDLLQFLSRAPKNAKGRSPLDVLLDRRPDLEFILLTCENTNTPLPAIDLANEVLESMVALGKMDASAAHDTGSVTAEELAANPQYTIAKARDLLRDAVHPIHLPFDLRLATARAYLQALGTSRQELMRALRRDALLPASVVGTEEAIAAEALGLSSLDFELVTGMQFGGAAAAAGSLEDLHGLDATSLAPLLKLDARGNIVRLLQQKLNAAGVAPPLAIDGGLDTSTEAVLKTFQTSVGLPPTGTTTPATWTFLDAQKPDTAAGLLCWVTEFMQRTALHLTDLVAICSTRTFNPMGAGIAALNTTKVTWGDIENLALSGFTLPNAAIVAGAGVLGITVPELVAWLKTRASGIAGGIVVEAVGDGCDLADAYLHRIDGDIVPSATLVAINRFLRLARKTGLETADLDVALSALAALGIGGTTDADMPPALAALLRLRDRLKLSMPELAVLTGHFQTGPRSLYTQLFLNRAALALDPSFGLTMDGTELALTAETLDAHVPALIAAFRIGAEDLARVRRLAGLDAATETLGLQTLARLYRYALLARALEVGIDDLLTMLALSSPDPWLASTDQPMRLERLIADQDALAASEIAPAVVDQLLRHVARVGSGEMDPDRVGDQAATLHEQQVDLAAELGGDPGMSIERFQTLLARLVAPESVDQFLGIVTGSATFTAPYAKVPTPAAVAAFAPNVTFDALLGTVRFARIAMPPGSVVTLGALTDAEKLTLQAAAGADADLVQAVDLLHARPRRLLADTLAGLPPGPAVALAVLADGPGARSVEGKLRFIVETLLPFIHEALASALVKQQLLPFAGLAPPLLALLIDDSTVVTAPGSSAALGTPLRALEQSGWSATFFTSTSLTGAFATGVDASLDHDGAVDDFGQSAPVGSARWSAVFLPRLAGSVVFEVTTNGTPALFWDGVAVPATVAGQRWRFDARPVAARERI